ncbi:hypothetical protein PsorP6_010280 [Peronosclerospora sorghi]|uniref:Uncharacterized protein n=1 Tax=Peronosclerospora sorghi TaxID=230839 RepID=A0ACC0VVQ1_9STRA|nr:hypothetical protein PsorP6_010280 [Peronosclerospora sorghi]
MTYVNATDVSNGDNVYAMGLDPIWITSSNELLFFNSFKMKNSLIFGIDQNSLYFREYATFFFESVPQLVFAVLLFCYMVVLIVFKWSINWTERMKHKVCPYNFAGDHTSCRPPSLVNTLINIALSPGNVVDPLYEGQLETQQLLFPLEPERSAFLLYVGLKKFTAMNHLQSSAYGVLHVGDKFLCLKNGELSPGKMRADHLNDDLFLIMRMSYRGAQAESTCIVLQNGLNADLTIFGWVMPLTLLQVFCETMDVFSVLWVADTETIDRGVDRTCAPESVSTYAWMEVPEFVIQIRAPILEAYLDDSHCVAKLTIENSSSSYYDDPGVENFKLHLGPTVLIVLTEDVALRLVQVGKFWLSNDLLLHRQTRAAFIGCALCADESSRDRCVIGPSTYRLLR